MSGRGTFHVIDGALQSVPSFDLGMLWCTIPMPQNYVLELEFFVRTFQTNSGIFVRFRNPDSVLAADGTPFSNPAWSAVFGGFEIQIDAWSSDAPDTFALRARPAYQGICCKSRGSSLQLIHGIIGLRS